MENKAVHSADANNAATTSGPDGYVWLVEATHTYHSDLNTGIQRVVRNVLRHLIDIGREQGFRVIPVIVEGTRLIIANPQTVLADKAARKSPQVVRLTARARVGALIFSIKHNLRAILRKPYDALRALLAFAFPYKPWRDFLYAHSSVPGLTWGIMWPYRTVRRGLRHIFSGTPATTDSPIDPWAIGTVLKGRDVAANSNTSTLLLLDSSWSIDPWPAAVELQTNGTRIVSVIYDLIPITHPHTSVAHLVDMFKLWMNEQVRHADEVVCISKAIRDEVREYFKMMAPQLGRQSSCPISYFYLGSELDLAADKVAQVPAELVKAAQAGAAIFLMVGTIEPRKNHRQAFESFKLLWSQGIKATLVIVGKQSWKTESLLEELSVHPELGNQLFVLRNASDADVYWLYQNANALVIASEVEGFGLPIVEARQQGMPVLCSDIPVFRELADEQTRFFRLGDAQDLRDELLRFMAEPAQLRKTGQWMNWRQSAQMLLDEFKPVTR